MLVVLVTVLLAAQGVAPLPPHDQSADVFVARTLSGRTVQGHLANIGKDWAITLQGEQRETIPGEELLWVRSISRRLPEPPRGPYLLLVNGDRIPAEVVAASSERFQARPTTIKPDQIWELPLTAARGFWLQSPNQATDPERVQWHWEKEGRDRDRLTLRNGDAVQGIWEGLEQGTILLQTEGGLEKVPMANVATVGLNTALLKRKAVARVTAQLVLIDGTRISLAKAELSRDGLLHGESVFGPKVTIPLTAICSLDLQHERKIHLSDLTPVEEIITPYLDTRWPAVRDGSAARRWLRLDGNVYAKGVGLHSQCQLTYDLAGRYQAFVAQVGLDDRSGRRGSARVKVAVDGQERYASPELVGGRAAVAIHVNVQAARRLSLFVEFGKNGDIADHVNWVEACLLSGQERVGTGH
jgi:hypothetical protein